MPLVTGTRCGPYEILTPIGAGGMGEVYRARDTKLKRDVALKVLPEAFAKDPGRMLRFQREAEVLASLNHPNIAHIYGVEERALAMELVEGQTLPCPLPIDTALAYAKQIAEALEYAHERGVIHRDLKPANIKVTPEGVVKILDFGLAKAVEEPGSDTVDPSASPTLTLGHTQVGVVMGTAAYIAPEQAAGAKVDRRADIWSFGAVLYEMLSGKRAFGGDSVADTLATVMKLDPDWSALPKDVPASIYKLVRRCLIRDRKQRLQAIGEARILLEAPSGTEVPPQADVPTTKLLWLACIFAAAMTSVAGIALWGWLRPRLPEPRPVMRFASPMPVARVAGGIAVSRDGSRIAFVGGPHGQIYVRTMDQLEARPIPGTENAAFLGFSPDGEWIGFMGGGQGASPDAPLKKVAFSGGPPQTLAEGRSIIGPSLLSWRSNGEIVFTSDAVLKRISSNGGDAELLASPNRQTGERYYTGPQVLPGGRWILISIANDTEPNRVSHFQIAVFNPQTRVKKVLLERGGIAQYLPSKTDPTLGFLLYYDGTTGSLMAAAFDSNRLEVKSAPTPAFDGIEGALGPFGVFGLSEGGTLAYVPGGSVMSEKLRLVWVDRDGTEHANACPARAYVRPRLSPDGKRVAVEIQGADGRIDIWVCDLERGSLSRITSENLNRFPLWTADGTHLLYTSGPSLSQAAIVSMAADGEGQSSVLTSATEYPLPSSVSLDGKMIAGGFAGAVSRDMFILPISGAISANGKLQTLLPSRFSKAEPQFSPDGHYLAYRSEETGSNEIYVTEYPGPGRKWTISAEGGREPRWSRSGELFYRSSDKIKMADIQTKPAFRPGSPKTLFEGNYGVGYDVSPDGKRLLMIKGQGSAVAASPTNQLNIVVNWSEELRRRVPLEGR